MALNRAAMYDLNERRLKKVHENHVCVRGETRRVL